MLPYYKKTFPNGLKAIVAPLKDTKTITLLVLVKVGSRHEPQNLNGVSHFIEHMMFKGTVKRPTTLQISKELDGVGAECNAFTQKDQTGYHIKVNHEKKKLAFDVLSDMLKNSLFDPKELNRERGVIEEEINMYKDNPQSYVDSLFEELLYGKDNRLGQLISGPKAVIRKVTRSQMMRYKKKYYHPRNMLVVISGKINPQEGFRLIEKHFNWERTKDKASSFSKVKVIQNAPRAKVEYKKTEQVQLCLGFPAYSYFHKDLEALYLLNIILGGNMSSRLFINIRERQGLCYFIRSSANIYEDIGNFVIQSGLDRRRISQAIVRILEEIKKIKQTAVSSEELDKAKEYLKGRLTLEMEDSEQIAGWYGIQQLLTGKTLTLEQKLRKIQKVKIGDIQRVAKDIFQTSKINLALIGPFTAKQEFLKLLKI
ncbi:MAG: hypothetical protein COY66_02235 [Candidatus Kerfeldbacteria bacterium CG_4_10_14_0_8_um_filter_42_10]|uniref:Peptidase M16 n=1 Tax=Candidatus Kerfeldbacteria bacterium CG_4_10_14_0_8_um_filter_42_10 TaxID=2014248 RepID=A0A2M7RKA7_9BACT|nr:MAG: hypothetical protein COY66_02235 [Candidatus Kerfeldbacteria bacterium CG_4_10_14_0_8_um_filter_42_10]